jgi:hypothetical protein
LSSSLTNVCWSKLRAHTGSLNVTTTESLIARAVREPRVETRHGCSYFSHVCHQCQWVCWLLFVCWHLYIFLTCGAITFKSRNYDNIFLKSSLLITFKRLILLLAFEATFEAISSRKLISSV